MGGKSSSPTRMYSVAYWRTAGSGGFMTAWRRAVTEGPTCGGPSGELTGNDCGPVDEQPYSDWEADQSGHPEPFG